VRKFAALSAEWWNSVGPFQALHALNVARVRFIRDAAQQHFEAERASSPLPDEGAPGAGPTNGGAEQAWPFGALHGLRVLDVGCGGGILAESLARLGAHVTGVDATAENIAVARAHAALDPAVAPRITCASEGDLVMVRGHVPALQASRRLLGRLRRHCLTPLSLPSGMWLTWQRRWSRRASASTS